MCKKNQNDDIIDDPCLQMEKDLKVIKQGFAGERWYSYC